MLAIFCKQVTQKGFVKILNRSGIYPLTKLNRTCRVPLNARAYRRENRTADFGFGSQKDFQCHIGGEILHSTGTLKQSQGQNNGRGNFHLRIVLLLITMVFTSEKKTVKTTTTNGKICTSKQSARIVMSQ